jgi:signal transduction histidine kinase
MAVIVAFVVSGVYWGAVLAVRLGPGRGAFELSALGLALVGTVDVVLQMAQGISGFSLPAAPLVAVNALCFSQYLMIPLNLPMLLRRGLAAMPLRSQVRGAELGTFVALAGAGALLLATWSVHQDRPWAVPFSLGVISVLFVLAGLRQLTAVSETRRLHRVVEEASDERRQLLSQLLERSVHDRRRFAGQLYEQAVAAYTSLTLLARTGEASSAEGSSAATLATSLVGDDLHRHAESVRELVQAIRPSGGVGRGAGGDGADGDGDVDRRHRLFTPLRAYLTSVYGDQPAPQLTLEIADELNLDWISETVLLQIAQEALHNVWRHSDAARVDVSIEPVGDAVALHVVDDGRGFDVAAVPEGSGIAVMRASAAAVGGTLAVESMPLEGTTVTARLLPGGAPPVPPSRSFASRTLRLVRDADDIE